MSKICVFAGTTEGREIVNWLADQGAEVFACAATEYGGTLLCERENVTVSAKRLTESEMAELLEKERFDIVIDATHPFAPIVTENIFGACEKTNTAYLRLLREDDQIPEGSVFAESTEEAVKILSETTGNILLTVGSKELPSYAALPGCANRVFARVLPVESSIKACTDIGLSAAHIIAMQGPFTHDMNVAMLGMIKAEWLVTKDSGAKGGFPEKAAAAKETGTKLLVIGRPPQKSGYSFKETVVELQKRFGFKSSKSVCIVGIGPGDRSHMTIEASEAIANAQCLIGAKRMLEAVSLPGQLTLEAIAPDKIKEAIESHPEFSHFAVVMAGDVGFFSGTKKLLPLLKGYDVKNVPGLSSLVCLCSRLGTSYEDVVPVSLHGRTRDIAGAIANVPRAFVLVGGENGMGKLCKELSESGMGDARVSAGECLGYPNEKITVGTASELKDTVFNSLAVALIEHEPKAIVTHGLPDETFQRGSHADGSVVPMTKREIRSASLSSLELTEDAVCWDIGAGTGSVAIEMALLAKRGSVYAIEKKEGAIELLKENVKKLHAENLTVVEGAAPAACEDLPAPTHVFIGGSSGNMKQILKLLLEKNPHVRVVATAVTLESIAELNSCLDEFAFSEQEVVSINASRARKLGSYRLMTAQNPVYIFTMQNKQ